MSGSGSVPGSHPEVGTPTQLCPPSDSMNTAAPCFSFQPSGIISGSRSRCSGFVTAFQTLQAVVVAFRRSWSARRRQEEEGQHEAKPGRSRSVCAGGNHDFRVSTGSTFNFPNCPGWFWSVSILESKSVIRNKLQQLYLVERLVIKTKDLIFSWEALTNDSTFLYFIWFTSKSSESFNLNRLFSNLWTHFLFSKCFNV